jgi:phenylphosphate carboxylase alpha subunit
MAEMTAAPFDELRDYIEALRDAGELYEISEAVDWDLEIGAISRLALERDDPRPVWFHRITDYPGHSAFAHLVTSVRTAAIALRLPPDTAPDEVKREYLRRVAKPVAPIEVESGPCQTHVVRGDDIDLTDLPAPMLHEGDGGRYVGTWDLVVSQDPDSRETNWGVYRFLLHDRRILAGVPRWATGLGTVLRTKYVPRGEPMPIAIVIGADPLSHIAASGRGDEACVAGGLRGAPVRLVKAVTSELRVPAHAQTVIEGVILPDRIGREGPYGEYTAYRTADGDRGVAVRVDAVTFRDDPIHTLDCTGWRASATPFGQFGIELAFRQAFGARGVKVVEVSAPLDLAYHAAFVSVERGGREVAEIALDVLEQFAAGVSRLFLFNSDIDVTDQADVMHAFTMRCHPVRGILQRSHVGKAKPLMPFLSAAERDLPVKSASVVFDCTWPSDWDALQDVPAKGFFENIYSEEVKSAARRRWRSLGFPE